MKEMIRAMVQEMVMQSIKEVMAEMMDTSPEVAPAEVAKPVRKTMTKEEFFALEEETPKKSSKDYSTLVKYTIEIEKDKLEQINKYNPIIIREDYIEKVPND